MAASSKQTSSWTPDGKYGEDAVMILLQNAAYYDTSPSDYEFKMFGCGNMFPAENGSWPCKLKDCGQVIKTCRNVSCRNSNFGRALLKQRGLNVTVEHMGGTAHRNVIFDI